jgi:hypothetical protein
VLVPCVILDGACGMYTFETEKRVVWGGEVDKIDGRLGARCVDLCDEPVKASLRKSSELHKFTRGPANWGPLRTHIRRHWCQLPEIRDDFKVLPGSGGIYDVCDKFRNVCDTCRGLLDL